MPVTSIVMLHEEQASQEACTQSSCRTMGESMSRLI